MATAFDTVENLAMIAVNDHRLGKLLNQSRTDFQTYVDGFLIMAVPEFTKCRQSLDYNTANRTFTADLTQLEQKILAELWVAQWMTRDNNTYALYRSKLQNTGSFKNHSEAQNLKEWQAALQELYENIDRWMVAYQLEALDEYM